MALNIQLKEIQSSLPGSTLKGDPEKTVNGIESLKNLRGQDSDKNFITWISDKNATEGIINVTPGLLIVSSLSAKTLSETGIPLLIVENPRLSFLRIMEKFFAAPRKKGVEKTAIIHPSAKLGSDCYIGHFTVIGENVILGNEVEIQHQTVIMENTVIGNQVKIGCNCTIGNTGFGYEKDEEGNFLLLPHLGNVMLEDKVEIGNNTCIDRAVTGSTILRENVKVDNLVHIAHGVEIGKNAMIIANAMIAGSVKIGENAWVAPSSSILNQKTLGKNAVVGLGAVVIKNVGENEVVAGNPAKPLIKKT